MVRNPIANCVFIPPGISERLLFRILWNCLRRVVLSAVTGLSRQLSLFSANNKIHYTVFPPERGPVRQYLPGYLAR